MKRSLYDSTASDLPSWEESGERANCASLHGPLIFRCAKWNSSRKILRLVSERGAGEGGAASERPRMGQRARTGPFARKLPSVYGAATDETVASGIRTEGGGAN